MDDRCAVTRRLLAQKDSCSIEECSCGVLHVTLGALTLRLHRESVASIWETLGEALATSARLRDEGRPRTSRSAERPS